MTQKNVLLLLRSSLAFVFIYAGSMSLINPNDWIGFIPAFIQDIINPRVFLMFYSIYEIILGLWLLSGVFIWYSALLSLFTVIGIIFGNISQFIVVFRDIPMIFISYILMASQKNPFKK